MGQSPPQSPRRAGHSPLLFTPQMSYSFMSRKDRVIVWGHAFSSEGEALPHVIVCLGVAPADHPMNPMVPLQRPDDLLPVSNTWRRNTSQFDDIIYERGIPTMITWSYGGKEVAVEGSWDNWITKKVLQKSGKDFTIMKVLPSGVYQYRFSVDGECRYSPDMPWVLDEFGNAFNILDLQDSVPEEIGSVAGFEPPLSPESSYNNWALDSEDLAKEPPSLPPQLGFTLLNSSNSNENSLLSRPQHVVLNHLFIQKGRSGEPAVALSATHRFRAKYVTVVFYKSLQR